MRRSNDEDGFTLIELLVVVGIVVVVIATFGVFFLAGPSPAVASATRDITAAFGEARETAVAFSESTVVFTASASGSGYSARVYREMPGDGGFAALSGPTYESSVTIAETAVPLGSPGFAFRVDRNGTVTGYQHFSPADTSFTTRSCPTSGAFTLALARGDQKQTVTIPCTLSVTAENAGITITPPPAVVPSPDTPGTCAPAQNCAIALTTINATCPPGYVADGTQPDVCNTPSPGPSPSPQFAPTCPPGETGAYPDCTSPSPSPSPTATNSNPPGATRYWYSVVYDNFFETCTQFRGFPYCSAATFYRVMAGVTLINGADELVCSVGQINYGAYSGKAGQTNVIPPSPIPTVPGIPNYPDVASATTDLPVSPLEQSIYSVGQFEFFWTGGCTGISSNWKSALSQSDPDFVNGFNTFFSETPLFPGLSVPSTEYAS
jgi:prepilin-type N-terminal cleavage/methylation domain-containing protein